ncbi:MAG: hypothetical protein HQL52_12705 [Magnetococcales bacterium]|nr:hypothetical protein [Magnetococcales bacterium]
MGLARQAMGWGLLYKEKPDWIVAFSAKECPELDVGRLLKRAQKKYQKVMEKLQEKAVKIKSGEK